MMMTISHKALLVLTLFTTCILAIGYASTGLMVWVILIIACGLFWLFGLKAGWDWAGTTGLIFFMAAITRGIFLDLPSGWLLLSVVSALLAWDLHQFINRLEKAGRIEKRSEIERRHLKRIMIIAGLSLILGTVALLVELELGFGWMLFWGVLLVLSLSRLFDVLGRENNQ
ncbi:hypothetical protein ACFL7M_08010 [Thermodesulfobacteriota bacterium]